MTFDEMQKAVTEAERTLRTKNWFVGKMADLIAGNLRNSDVSRNTLKQLKAELSKFNGTTKRWGG